MPSIPICRTARSTSSMRSTVARARVSTIPARTICASRSIMMPSAGRIYAGSPTSSRRARTGAARANDAWHAAMLGAVRRRVAAIGALALIAAGACPAAAGALHPLDPLDADELATIGAVLKKSGRFSENTNFAWVQLDEPAKALVQAFKPGVDFPRRASLDAIDYSQKKAFAVVVDIKAKQLVSVTDLAGAQPGLTDRETDIASEVLNADPRIKAALVAHGLKIPGELSESVGLQFAPIGHDPSIDQRASRLVR